MQLLRLVPGASSIVAVLLLALWAAAPASAASVLNITPAADPVAETSVSVTLAGSSDAATRLYLFASTGQTFCWSTPADQDGIPVVQDQMVNGPFSTTVSFTPPTPGSYRLCGFLGDTSMATPRATAAQTISVRQARASVAIDFDANPPGAGGGPVQITVHGVTELARRLWLITIPIQTSCFPIPSKTKADAPSRQRPNPGGELLADGDAEHPARHGLHGVCIRRQGRAGASGWRSSATLLGPLPHLARRLRRSCRSLLRLLRRSRCSSRSLRSAHRTLQGAFLCV